MLRSSRKSKVKGTKAGGFEKTQGEETTQSTSAPVSSVIEVPDAGIPDHVSELTFQTGSHRHVNQLINSRTARGQVLALTEQAAAPHRLKNNAELFVGREKELAALRDAVERLFTPDDRDQNPRVINIVGAAGSGKSRLAQQICRQVRERDGFFVTGKMNLGDLQVYSGLNTAMEGLAKQILERDFDESIRKRLRKTFQKEASILLEIFPALQPILECTDIVVNLPIQPIQGQQESNQTQRANQRKYLFQKFIQVITLERSDDGTEDLDVVREESPTVLVLVLDDLQWIDLSSLDLISALVKDQEIPNLLILTTCRPIKVKGGADPHPFLEQLQQWRAQCISIQEHFLDNLNTDDIHSLLCSMFDIAQGKVDYQELAQLIHQKTEGNIFFAIEFIRALVHNRLLAYSFVETQWKYDLQKVQAMVVHEDTAVSLLTDKLEKLVPDHQLTLIVAACLGVTFTAYLVQYLLDVLDPDDILTLKEQQEAQDILNPIDPAPNTAAPNGTSVASVASSRALNGTSVGSVATSRSDESLAFFVDSGYLGQNGGAFFFSHDLIKQAAMQFCPADKLTWLKWQLGKRILQGDVQMSELEQAGSQKLLFLGVDLCNAYLQGGNSFEMAFTSGDPGLRLTNLANFNFLAGEKAMRKSSFALAVKYMRNGLQIVESAEFQNDPAQASVHRNLIAGAAQASHFAGNFGDMEYFANQLLQQKDCPRELELKMLYYMVVSKTSLEEMQQAVDTGMSAVKLIGQVKLSSNPGVIAVISALIKTKKVFDKQTKESLLALKLMTDEKRLATLRFFKIVSMPAYVCNPAAFLVTQLKAVRWAVKYGISEYIIAGLSLYGVIKIGEGDVATGTMLGEVALALGERLGSKAAIAEGSMMIFSMVYHWTINLCACRPPLIYAYKLSMEIGDIENAITSALALVAVTWSANCLPIKQFARDLKHYCIQCLEFKHKSLLKVMSTYAKGLRKLVESDSEFTWLDDPSISKMIKPKVVGEKVAPVIQVQEDANALQSHFLLGEEEEALKFADDLFDIEKKAIGQPYTYRAHFYRALLFLSLVRKEQAIRKNLQSAKKVLKLLSRYVENGNLNCNHMVFLLKAELASIEQDQASAKQLYTKAILAATQAGNTNDAAICNEHVGLFFLRCQDESQAAHHIEKAMELFFDWGATRVVTRLRKKHLSLITAHNPMAAQAIYMRD